jgi:hypothetical protein
VIQKIKITIGGSKMKNAHTLSARTMDELIRVASVKSFADQVIDHE